MKKKCFYRFHFKNSRTKSIGCIGDYHSHIRIITMYRKWPLLDPIFPILEFLLLAYDQGSVQLGISTIQAFGLCHVGILPDPSARS